MLAEKFTLPGYNRQCAKGETSVPAKPAELLLISTDEECCAWVRSAFADRADCCLRHLDGPDVVDVSSHKPHAPLHEDSDIVIVDLDRTDADPTQFWASIRITYPKARVIGIVKPTSSMAVQQAALAARVEQFVRMCAPVAELLTAAWNLRRGYFLFGYWPVTEAALQLFQGSANGSSPRLKLYRGHRKACMGDREIALTSFEFAMLLYLAENAGRTVNTDELLDAVWKCPRKQGGSTAQVKHCVYRLRKKIELDQNRFTYLKTINGHGYWVENVEVV